MTQEQGTGHTGLFAQDIRQARDLAQELGRSGDLPALEEGAWGVEVDEAATLDHVLGRLGTGEWTGLAFTTRGTHVLRTVAPDGLRDTAGAVVERDTVYELRLWQPDGGPEPGVAAHELRWLNGSGCAEIRVYTSSRADGAPAGAGTGAREAAPPGLPPESCWYRRNRYLEHRSASRSGAASRMTALEVFTREPVYGNTVFTDEILTGRWT